MAKQVVDKVEEIRLKTTILNKLTTEDIYSVLLQTLHNGKLFCIWNTSANPNNELNLTPKNFNKGTFPLTGK
ncbi:MAG: hypothetical protein KA133_05690 [Flavobacterium sp.]|nr:hypothetical protein [Flavobacterium sp.]